MTCSSLQNFEGDIALRDLQFQQHFWNNIVLKDSLRDLRHA